MYRPYTTSTGTPTSNNAIQSGVLQQVDCRMVLQESVHAAARLPEIQYGGRKTGNALKSACVTTTDETSTDTLHFLPCPTEV